MQQGTKTSSESSRRSGAARHGGHASSLLPSEDIFFTSQFSLSIGASHVLAGQTLGIRPLNLNAGPGIEVSFDNVRLDATGHH